MVLDLLSLPAEIMMEICSRVRDQDEAFKTQLAEMGDKLLDIKTAWHGRGLNALHLSCKSWAGITGTLLFDTIKSSKVKEVFFQLTIMAKYRHAFKNLILDSRSLSDNSLALSIGNTLPFIESVHFHDRVAIGWVEPGFESQEELSNLADRNAVFSTLLALLGHIKKVTFVDPDSSLMSELLPSLTALQTLTVRTLNDEDIDFSASARLFQQLKNHRSLKSLEIVARYSCIFPWEEDWQEQEVTLESSSLTTIIVEGLHIEQEDLGLSALRHLAAASLTTLTLRNLSLGYHLVASVLESQRQGFLCLRSLEIEAPTSHLRLFLPVFRQSPLVDLHCLLLDDGFGDPPSFSAFSFKDFSPTLRSLSLTSKFADNDHFVEMFAKAARETWPLISIRARLFNGWETDQLGLEGVGPAVLKMTSYVESLGRKLVAQGDEEGLRVLAQVLKEVPALKALMEE